MSSMSEAIGPQEPTRAAVELVERVSGQVIPPYRWPLVEAELAALGRRHGAAGGLRRLEADDSEARAALLETLSVPETYLFRHVGHFELLEEIAVARARAGKATRVLCAGCSTGEEAWSAAAVLACVPPPEGQSHAVVGWDLCRRRLEKAALGRFTAWTGRRGLYRWEAAFETVGGSLTVTPRLRELVRFAAVNLVTGPIPSGPAADVLLFRNVAIYFRERVAHEVCRRLAGLTSERGVVMVGASDPVAFDPRAWRQRIEGGVRWFVRVASGAKPEALVDRPRPTVAASRCCTSSPAVGAAHRRRVEVCEATATPAGFADPTGAEATAATVDSGGITLERVRELADRGRYAEGLELLRRDRVLETVDGRLLQGILLMALDRNLEAAGMFRQCVFLRPEDPEPRRWLAAAFEILGEDGAAERERRNAQQLEAP